MAFGIGIGFKDGVGKASQFFAGCLVNILIHTSLISSEGDISY